MKNLNIQQQWYFLQIWHVYVVKVTQSCLTVCNPMDCQAPLSTGFSRQEYWSGLTCSSSGDLPNTGIEPRSLVLQVDFFTIWGNSEAHNGSLLVTCFIQSSLSLPNPMSILIIKEFAKDEYLPPSRGTLQPWAFLISDPEVQSGVRNGGWGEYLVVEVRAEREWGWLKGKSCYCHPNSLKWPWLHIYHT